MSRTRELINLRTAPHVPRTPLPRDVVRLATGMLGAVFAATSNELVRLPTSQLAERR